MEMIMITSAQPNSTIHLHQSGFQRINRARPGSELNCDAGVLWVTQTGDRKDYILLPGDTMIITNRGKVLVEAMRDADFRLV
jgi:hypothetical protein